MSQGLCHRQGLEAAIAADMGQPSSFTQHSNLSLPSLATGQASLGGPGMSYPPNVPMSHPQAAMVQPHQVMNHMLTNYMHMMHWSQVRPHIEARRHTTLLANSCVLFNVKTLQYLSGDLWGANVI